MSRRLPLGGFVFLCVVAALMVFTFVGLNRLFGGPGARIGEQPYTVVTEMPQTGQLLERSLVMINGVKVGEVTKVDGSPQRTRVTLKLDPKFAPLRQGAKVRLGVRTLFAEAYLRLTRGPASAAALPSGSTIASEPATEADEALEVLNPPTRRHLQSLSATTDRGIARGDDPARLRATTDELTAAAQQVRRVTEALDGQETELTELVAGARRLVGTVAQRDRSVRGIVENGTTTLRVLGDRTRQVEDSVTEANRTLGTANEVLTRLPGLIDDAGPAVDDLALAARDLRPAANRLGPTVDAAAAFVDTLPDLTDAAMPALRVAKPVVDQLEPLSVYLVPALRNVIPMLQWLDRRKKAFSTLLPLINASTTTDANGMALRARADFDPLELAGRPAHCDGRLGKGVSCPAPYDTDQHLRTMEPGTVEPQPRLMPYPEP